MIEINECIFGPKRAPEFLTCDDFSPLFQQRDEEQERLALKSDSRTFLLEFAIAKVDFENAKAN